MKYAQLKKLDIANGPGIRISLFVSGCTHKCKGCFNEEYQDFNYGEEFTPYISNKIKSELLKDYYSGITVLGGEPFQNLELIEIIKDLRSFISSSKLDRNIWIYSGYTFEQIMENPKMKELLSLCDVLVDGLFIEDLLDLNLEFRGSSNQRILDIKSSIKHNLALPYIFN